MQIAIKEAKNTSLDIPIAALIVKNGEIISLETNKREQDNRTIAHAEILAIENANKKLNSWRLEDCDMYVTLEPCPMCAGAILNARIKNVYIGAMEQRSGAAGSKINLFEDYVFNHKTNYESGILENECKQIMQNFFKMLRKRRKSIDNENDN